MDREENMSDKRDKLLGIHEGLDINTYMEMELIFSVFHSAPNRWPPARSAGRRGVGGARVSAPGWHGKRSARRRVGGTTGAVGEKPSILFFPVNRYV